MPAMGGRIEIFLLIFVLHFSSATFKCIAQKKIAVTVQLQDSTSRAEFDDLRKQLIPAEVKDTIQLHHEMENIKLKLVSDGYLTSSIDSFRCDSSSCKIYLFLGRRYQWAMLSKGNVDEVFLDGTGFRQKLFLKKPFRYNQVRKLQNRILVNCEDNGYPFASIRLDSIQI